MNVKNKEFLGMDNQSLHGWNLMKKNEFYDMELLNFIFRLGVVFAIFGFLFGLFELGLALLNAGRKKTTLEEYTIKLVKYLFLVDVTFLFCMDISGEEISQYNLVVTTLVLLTYFVGKLQNKQQQQAMFNMMGNGMMRSFSNFNLKAEIGVISMAIALFIFFVFQPELASNPASLWFHESILNIEDTPVFGFIFKIIGFFFLINMIFKMINAFAYLISGKAFIQARSGFGKMNNKKDDGFDDFEEIQ